MTPAERLAELEDGENPALITRMASGFLVMGSSQFLRGYCLLLAFPQVEKLNDLTPEHRDQFFRDMAHAGDAVLAATGCARINYSVYGNLDPFLHAHIWPRYEDEEESYRTLPPLSIPAEVRDSTDCAYDHKKHSDLQREIEAFLLNLPAAWS